MSDSRHPPLSSLFPFSLKDLKTTLFILAIAVGVCILLQRLDPSAGFAMPVFVLAVLLTSLLTTGYVWGLLSALLGVVAVNFFFTYPYWAFNLTITGYPLSFLTFLGVSVITSTLTTKTRQLDRLRMENEKIKMRADLLRSVSHDIRTPLTSILGYLQLLEDPGLTEGERREYLAVIAGRARTLQSLITSFYDLSRLEGGEYLLQREKVDLYASLSGLLAAFYNDFTGRGFDMEVELAEGLPQVWADAGAVLRIFTNLIRNALEHGEGRMEIRLYQEGGQVVSRFSNETHALTAEDVPHVFDRFFTSDKMRTGRNTGLGLAIVKALAGQMDCRAEAALEGDMFAITLRWPVERR